ncbi:MAG: BamA/TamA family outer membrane protein, partial [Myxococcales bacterium]
MNIFFSKMLTPFVVLTLALAVAPQSRADARPPIERVDATVRDEIGRVSQPDKEKDGVDDIALPLVGYNSDELLGFGVTGGAFIYEPGYAPYKHALAAQAYFTTGGVRSHFFRYDGPNFLGSGLRLESRLEFRREKFAPYYGPGNDASPEFRGRPMPGEELGHGRGPHGRHPYTFDKLYWGGWARVRLPKNEGLFNAEPYVGYAFRQNRIDAEDWTLLARQQPNGIDGGPTGQLLMGLIWDNRNDDTAPTRGGSLELSMRLAAPVTGSAYTYAQLTASARKFIPLHRRVVFAQRIVGDVLLGDVPFFEWQNIGGMFPAEGIGGLSSVRGLERMRYVGTSKVLSNSELRFTFFEPELFGQTTSFGSVAFLD